jgi:hypothetical protein
MTQLDAKAAVLNVVCERGQPVSLSRIASIAPIENHQQGVTAAEVTVPALARTTTYPNSLVEI